MVNVPLSVFSDNFVNVYDIMIYNLFKTNNNSYNIHYWCVCINIICSPPRVRSL